MPMMNWLKVVLISLITLGFAGQSHACRISHLFDPEKLEADVVIRGQVTSFANLYIQSNYPSPLSKNNYVHTAILCVETLETYFGETRSEWCFDVDRTTFSHPPRSAIPDDVIIAAKIFTPADDWYIEHNQPYFRALSVDGSIYNSGCTSPYLIPYSASAEREMVERLARLGFTSPESSN